ncbi:SagB/ThcOx family dehydrogenase [Sulfurimonas sp. NWX79]|uniref:SagB/ThcOx family dehydrogenase n=1 Tax=Sulfurimonas sp. NWX79 TaxID=2925412 RepID=UPI003204C56E
MNKDINRVFHYHEVTKHSQQRYARSLGYMDWSTQPDPFREYQGTQKTVLPLAIENATIPYSLLDADNPSAPLCKEALSQLLQFSLAIAAWKSSNTSQWAVRCNASSGNLHPTEAYLILPALSDISQHSSVIHYAPKEHTLELLAKFESDIWQQFPKGTFFLALSSIAWREVWKYGERAFRYVNLDAGHAWQSVVLSAKMLGWHTTRLDSLDDAVMAKLLGLDQKERFFETEHPDMVLSISPTEISPKSDISELVTALPDKYDGIANKLSPSMHEWEIIPQIIEATSTKEISQKELQKFSVQREPTKESKEVVLKRRSVHVMKSDISTITQKQFHTILASVNGSLDGKRNATHLCIFVHRVDGYKSGLYILLRDEADKESLQSEMHSDFLWQTCDLENLYFLKEDDYHFASKAISCSQDIASDGSFSLGMLCRFSEEIVNYGPHRYKELYWECGVIGQQLYLEATSQGLSGTGIGCYLDDTMHSLLGLKNNKFQILYHFTVGRGFVDSRIMTLPAYADRI